MDCRYSVVPYSLPWELLENRFERAGELCTFNSKLGIQELLANRKPENDAAEQQAILASVVSSGSVPAMSFARVTTVTPIVFRVATLVVHGSTSSELEMAIAALEAETIL